MSSSGEPIPPRWTATGAVHEWSMLERVGRSLLGLGMMWGLAWVCVFLPILHFVLVPSFVVAGRGRCNGKLDNTSDRREPFRTFRVPTV